MRKYKIGFLAVAATYLAIMAIFYGVIAHVVIHFIRKAW